MVTDDFAADAEFVRNLAKGMVSNEDFAEDLAQEVWVGALTMPPREEGAKRTWFYNVLRNNLFRHLRKEGRRAARAKLAPMQETTFPTPDQIIAREKVRLDLMKSVVSLEEPYRRAITLRYYEDLPPRKIAKQLKIPVETVKSQIKRGLDILRGKLDEECKGDRKEWLVPLLAVAGVSLAVPAAGAAAAGAAASAGRAPGHGMVSGLSETVVSSAPILGKIAVAALLLVGMGLVLYERISEDGLFGGKNDASLTETTDGMALSSGLAGGEGSAPGLGMGSEADKEAVPAETLVMNGQVVEEGTGIPVEAFDIEVDFYDDSLVSSTRVAGTFIQDKAGRFSLPVARAGVYGVKIWSSHHQILYNELVEILPEDSREIIFKLNPGYALSGRILEDQTGRPVAGALVVLNTIQSDLGSTPVNGIILERTAFDAPPMGIHTYSDGKGRFTLQGLYPDWFNLAVIHDQYAECQKSVHVSCSDLEIRLVKGVQISGKVIHDNRRPCRISITRASRSGFKSHTVLAGDDGSYAIGPLSPGMIDLFVEFSEGSNNGDPVGSSDQYMLRVGRSLLISDQDLEIDIDLLHEAVTWRGVLCGPGDEPVAMADLLLRPVGKIALKKIQAWIQTDESGRFEFQGLPKGSYSAWALCPQQLPNSGYIQVGDVTLDQPGVFEQNLYIPEIQVPEQAWENDEGIARIRIRGLDGLGLDRVLATFEHHQSGAKMNQSAAKISKKAWQVHSDGSCTGMVSLKAGDWTGTFMGKAFRATCDFHVQTGELIEVQLEGDDFQQDNSLACIAGRILYSDGEPPGMAILKFFPLVSTPKMKNEYGASCMLDDQGYYVLPCGMKPGTYRVTVTKGLRDFELGPQVIPENFFNPHIIDFTIARGATILGSLHDNETGQLCTFQVGPHIPVEVSLRDKFNEVEEASFFLDVDPARLNLENVAPGTYHIRIITRGYVDYEEGPIELTEGQQFPLGQISLAPACETELQLVDRDGKPLRSGENGSYIVRSISDPAFVKEGVIRGVPRLSLPRGTSFHVTIEAKGYALFEQEVTIEAGDEERTIPIELIPMR